MFEQQYAQQYTDITPSNRVSTDKPFTIYTYIYGSSISSSELCDTLHSFIKTHSYEAPISLDYLVDKIYQHNKVTIEIKPETDEIVFSFV
jgi:hypothetical protein